MFGKKYGPEREKVVSEGVAKACDTCGCIVVAEKLHQVEDQRRWGRPCRNYCGRCKPPYDAARVYRLKAGNEVRFYRIVPAHQVEVTEDGEEIIDEHGED